MVGRMAEIYLKVIRAMDNEYLDWVTKSRATKTAKARSKRSG